VEIPEPNKNMQENMNNIIPDGDKCYKENETL
jgi:hypothetical protein